MTRRAPPRGAQVMMVVGLAPAALWAVFTLTTRAYAMDLGGFFFVVSTGFWAYLAAVLVAGTAAVQALRHDPVPDALTWLLACATGAVVAGPWVYCAFARSIQG